jgi:hypothetical protein
LHPDRSVVTVDEGEVDVLSRRRELGENGRQQLVTVARVKDDVVEPFEGDVGVPEEVKRVHNLAACADCFEAPALVDADLDRQRRLERREHSFEGGAFARHHRPICSAQQIERRGLLGHARESREGRTVASAR